MIVPYVPSQDLRSAEKRELNQPKARLKTFGNRAFSVNGPSRWNKLRLPVRSALKVLRLAVKFIYLRKHLLKLNLKTICRIYKNNSCDNSYTICISIGDMSFHLMYFLCIFIILRFVCMRNALRANLFDVALYK